MSQKIKNIFISIGSSKKALYAIMAVVILAIVIPVLATYTGPNRTKTVKVCENVKVIDGCDYSATVKGLKVYDDPSITPTDHQWPCTISRNVCGNPSASSWKTFCDKSFPGVTWVTSNVLPPVQEIEIFHMEEQCHNETVAAPPATVNGSVSCTNGTNGWCRSDATLNITGSDPNPANTIIAIEGTRNGTDFACASDTCQIDATSNGSFAFEYWAVSSYGDTSYKGNTTITVDKEAPVVGLNLSGSMGYNSWYVSGVSWTTSLTDSVSGPSHVNISVDGASQSNPGSYATDGTHTIKATGYDNAGNSSQTQQTIQIDQTNPVPAYTLNGSLGTNGWYTSAVNWNASATDATSGVYAVATQLDGTSVNNSASIGTNGTHILQVTAQDNAGNMNSTSGSFKIDQEDPFISLNLSGTQGTHSWYTGPVSWSSTASDTVSGLASHTATLNGSTTTVNGSVNSDGTYTLLATAQDNASNQSTQTQSFGIDQSAPTVSMNPISGTNSNTVQLSGSSADATSGISYVEISIAGQTHQVNTTGAWSYQWNSTSACNGSVTASVRSVDQAGNISVSTTQTFTVENTPTTLTLPAQTDASNPVVFNLNTSNLNQMVIRISDDAGNLPAVTHTFTGTSIPSSYRWDRYMGDGSLAPKGTYTMNVRIYDKNTCTTDTASITLVVTESILSAWVSGAPTNTPIPPQFTPTEPANLSEDQIGQVESESFQTSLTPTIETTATDEAVVVLPTETPTSTPTTTPNPNPFVLPKADQKTTTSTSSSPKAPDSTPDPDPTNLSTGVLIGTAAAGLIGAMTAISSIKTSEKKKKKIVITNEESGLTGIVIAANQPAPTSISNIHVLASLAQNTENRLGDNDPGITEYDKKFFDRMAQQTENNTDSQDSTELKLIQSNQDWNPPVQPFLLSPFYNEYIHAMEAVTPNSCGVFGLEPIYTASGIASQSKMNTWLYDQRGKGLLSSNKILSWINEKTINISANNSGIGYSQTSDEQMEQFFKKYNDPIFNSDQMDPIVAGAAMEARIYEKISICEKYESCTPLIKVQIAGMAQNGPFLTEDQLIQVMKNENGVKSGFEELIINTPFKKDLRLGTENRLKNISYAIKLLPTIAVEQVSKLQFDTQFIPIYYINKMLTLSKFGYSLPEGVTREDLKRLKEEIKSYPNQRVTVWDIIKFNKQKYFDNEKKGKVNKSLKRSTDLSFTRHNSTTKTSRVGKNRNNINKVSVSSNGRKSIPATKISKARRNIRKNTPIYKNSYNKPTKVSKLGKSVQKTPSSSPVKKTILKKSSFTRKPTIRNSDVRKLTPKRTSTRTSTIKSIGKKVLTGIKNTTSRIRNIFRR